MKAGYFSVALFLVWSWINIPSAPTASAESASLLKAKQEAEAKGYIFFTSHDEIVARAKTEGKLHVLTSTDQDVLEGLAKAFMKKYPFIDVIAQEVSGRETYQRMLQEMKAGIANWDVNYVAFDDYKEYIPYQKKFDILGMARHGVLKSIPDLVDPKNRHIVSPRGHMQVVVYNKELIASDRVPSTWEGFLKPELKGRKMATDVRAVMFAALVPTWGLEKTVDYAKKFAAQKPIWMRGMSRIVSSVAAGEVPMGVGVNFTTASRYQRRDVKGVFGFKAAEPVPTRLSSSEAVLAVSQNPHAALLWLEFHIGPEGQKTLDEFGSRFSSGFASMLTPGSIQEQVIRGKKISFLGHEHLPKMGEYQKAMVEAFGFPTAEKRRRK